MKITWAEKTVHIKDLKPYERNPRRISKEAFTKLKESLEQDGYHGRMLCTPELKVIGGHQRLKVLKELGYKEVNVLVPDRELTEDEYRRILIRDNLQAGEWDMDELANSFTIDELKDWGFPEHTLAEKVEETTMPVLNSGEKGDFEQKTYTLHKEQADIIDDAIIAAKLNPLIDTGLNDNNNANALTFICAEFLVGRVECK